MGTNEQASLHNKRKDRQELYRLSESARFGLLCLLLLLMLVAVAFTASDAIQAMQSLQKQSSAVKSGQVTAIRPWMTVRVVAHLYHVPEDYLYQSLHVDNSPAVRRETLYGIASHERKPVSQIIHTLQYAVLTYRRTHPATLTPAAQPRMKHPSPTPGRTKH
jgi:hypothetical protein